MAVNKRHHKIIKDGFKEIFKTETKTKGSYEDGAVDELKTVVKEPITDEGIRQLAQLTKYAPVSVIMKRSGTGISITFF